MKTALRQSMLTGRELPECELIRLVLSPDGQIIADLNAELEGTDAWVECQRSVLEEAVKSGVLAAHFGIEKNVTEAVPEQVERALRRKALNFLGITKRDGSLLSGFAKVTGALNGGTACLLLIAKGQPYEGKDDITHLADGVQIVDCFSLKELQSALSSGNAVHVVLKGKAIADRCIEEITRLLHYEERFKLDDQR
jgi:predicted RNA-binding protein YlxR (DUF448 family)